MTRRANHTITQSVPIPPHPPVVSPSHLRDRLVDKHVANPVRHPLQRQEVPPATVGSQTRPRPTNSPTRRAARAGCRSRGRIRRPAALAASRLRTRQVLPAAGCRSRARTRGRPAGVRLPRAATSGLVLRAVDGAGVGNGPSDPPANTHEARTPPPVRGPTSSRCQHVMDVNGARRHQPCPVDRRSTTRGRPDLSTAPDG